MFKTLSGLPEAAEPGRGGAGPSNNLHLLELQLLGDTVLGTQTDLKIKMALISL